MTNTDKIIYDVILIIAKGYCGDVYGYERSFIYSDVPYTEEMANKLIESWEYDPAKYWLVKIINRPVKSSDIKPFYK